jgi:hypothetical protein
MSYLSQRSLFKPIYERLDSLRWTFPHHHKGSLCVRIEFSQSSVLYSISNSTFRECDATIINTSYAYESASLDAMKRWFSDMQKEIYVFGPHLPSGYGAIETQNGEEGASIDIETFLGEMLVQHGKGSVFFVRFFPSESSTFQLNKFLLRFPLALSSIPQFRNTLMS